jgi:histone H3/H4
MPRVTQKSERTTYASKGIKKKRRRKVPEKEKKVEKKKRKAGRGERAGKAILDFQYGMSTTDKNQKTESFQRFRRRVNNASKNIRSDQRIGKIAANMLLKDRNDFISQVVAKAVSFTNSRGRKQVQKRDILYAFEDLDLLAGICPHMVRV